MDLPRRLSSPGPIIEYIAELQRSGLKKKADFAIGAIRSTFNSPDGAKVLDLFEKAILERSIDPSADPRALDANNAQSFIALDLRRILSDEFDAKTEPSPPRMGTTGRRRGTAS
mgnify:CR=1 FL=1